MNGKMRETIQSRKFWFALIAALVPVLNSELGLNLDTTAVLGVIGAIMAWVLGEAFIDGSKIKNGNGNNHIVEKPKEVLTELPKSETIEKLDETSNLLTKATAELWHLEKSYKEGRVSLVVTLAAVEAWKVKYPDWKFLVPPGWPHSP